MVNSEVLYATPFVLKLWKMVNDPSTDHIISWNSAGDTIIIRNKQELFFNLIPQYSIYGSYATFIRQLNMYGFQRICNSRIIGNTDAIETDSNMQYRNQYFRRDEPKSLRNIKRSIPRKQPVVQDVQSLCPDFLAETDCMSNRNMQQMAQLDLLKKDNIVLWRELVLLRKKHRTQKLLISKIVSFLDVLVTPTPLGISDKRPSVNKSSSSKRSKIESNMAIGTKPGL